MALTLKAEQQLEAEGLIQLFTQHEAAWLAAAQRTYQFVQASFPQNSQVRRDDVAKALRPVLEVNEILVETLATKRLKQKYWVSDFTDLIIDRVWGQIQEVGQ